METKEAILATISELNNIDFKEEDNKTTQANNGNTENEESKNIFIDIKEENIIDMKKFKPSDEITTLLKLKEKSLVLFEGLKHSKSQNIEIKLEMVINYLEYQLYILEDRLKTLEDKNTGFNNKEI